ncbi:MAG: hypothetical protein IJG63_06335 [Oscillospiraceae bacterium]|nr:hypothetical protein [Oscillospiraceae bacterium]
MTKPHAYRASNRMGAAVILNCTLIILELMALGLNIDRLGTSLFLYYTQDSNLLALVAAILYSIYATASIRRGTAIPAWMPVLKFTAVCCLMMTLCVTAFILAPALGEGSIRYLLFTGTMFYQHFLCPLLALASFLFFETELRPTRSDCVWAVIPTVLYGAVLILLNVAHAANGPYFFFMIYDQPVYMSVLWCALLFFSAYIISRVVRQASLYFSDRYSRIS